MALITTTTSLADLADCDLVVEAVPEQMALKAGVLSALDKVCRPDVILASNTSSLSVTQLSVRTGRPSRVVGMHFFKPRRRAAGSSSWCARWSPSRASSTT